MYTDIFSDVAFALNTVRNTDLLDRTTSKRQQAEQQMEEQAMIRETSMIYSTDDRASDEETYPRAIRFNGRKKMIYVYFEKYCRTGCREPSTCRHRQNWQ